MKIGGHTRLQPWKHEDFFTNITKNPNYTLVVPGQGKNEGRTGVAASKWAY